VIKVKQFTKVGIVGMGGYVPNSRIKVEEIAEARDKDGQVIKRGLGIKQKAVEERDEDTVSMAVEASRIALKRAGVKANELGAILVGSESHVYAVKPTGSIVGDILGIENEYLTADLEFACKAGTTGLIMIAGLIEAGVIECGIGIGADVAQSKPGDVLEYTAGAGAAAVVLGSKKYKWMGKLDRINSFNSDTGDFWRRSGQEYPEHSGRFTGEPGYFKHVVEGTKRFLSKSKTKIKNYSQVVLHMPNGKFPSQAAKRLGIKDKQLKTGWIVEEIGNPYSASAMLGLVKVMEEGRKGEKILVTSYGSGAGSDSLSFEILKKNRKEKDVDIANQLKDVEQISYSEYLKVKGVI